MKKVRIFLVLIFLFKYSNVLAYSSNPKEFVLELVNEAVTVLSNKSLSKEEKLIFIEKVASENVDITALSLYTLGEIRKTASKEQITNYQIAFEKYFLKTLTSRLSDYSESKFEFVSEDQKSSNYTIISTKISPENGDPEIKIDWRIYTKNPEKPLIRDLIVEGLSLARTQKEEFKSILQNNDGNIDYLFKSLEEFIIK